MYLYVRVHLDTVNIVKLYVRLRRAGGIVLAIYCTYLLDLLHLSGPSGMVFYHPLPLNTVASLALETLLKAETSGEGEATTPSRGFEMNIHGEE
jgi:hypothetical protein